jgi:integrase-like protein
MSDGGCRCASFDCVVFADPKQSRIDIVQAAGRALRRFSGKKYGYILLPLIVPSKMEFSKFAETTAFRQVVSTITALSTQDERIAEEFRGIEKGRIPSGKIVEIEGDVPVGMKIKLGEFAEAISTRLWQSVGRANWRRFDDAHAFVRDLDLKSAAEWYDYCKSGKKPADIPTAPDQIYADTGWSSWGDWLGTGYVAHSLRQFRPFKKARAFVRGLGFKSRDEWHDYCNSGKKPADIPNNPHDVYAKAGWVGMGNWLGTGRIANQFRKYRSFKTARAFARRLGLKSEAEWLDYCKSGKKPADIPVTPYRTYANAGWVGMGDWLGTGRLRGRGWRPFKKARSFVRRLGLKSGPQWYGYCKSGKKPNDIPSNPQNTYAKAGWAGMGDWLGTGFVYQGLRQYKPFRKARAFVRGLGLASNTE